MGVCQLGVQAATSIVRDFSVTGERKCTKYWLTASRRLVSFSVAR